MHQKYASDGVVCMSVSLDLPESRDAALKFLQDKKATFANYWLDEEQDVAQEKFDMFGPPVVFVFNREGKWTKFDFTDPDQRYSYADVERFVQQLLAQR